MNGPSQSETQTSPLVLCRLFFVLSSSSLLLTEPIILYIVGGKALNERYPLLDEKRERERGKNLISCGSSFVCWPWVAECFFFHRPRASSSSSCRVSISEEAKTLFFFFLFFSSSEKRIRNKRSMIGTMPTKCRTHLADALFVLTKFLRAPKKMEDD